MFVFFHRPALLFKNTPSNRHIWKLSWPIFLSMLTIPVVMITDTIMIGRLNANSLAAAAQGGVLFWVVASFFIGLGIGVQVMSARRFGEKNFRQAGHILFVSLGIAILAGIFLAMAGWYLLPSIASLISDSEFVLETVIFTRYRFIGLPFYFIVFIFRGFFDGIGQTTVGLIGSIAIMITNFGLNLLLIFGVEDVIPSFGLQGAAMASSMAAIPGIVVHLANFSKKKYRIYVSGKAPGSAKKTILNVIKSGMPTALEQSIANTSMVVFFSFAAILGTKQTAISGIILNVMSLSFMPGYALGTTAATILGQAVAKNKIKLAIISVYKSACFATILMTTMGVFFIAFGDQIFGIFSNDPSLAQQGIYALYIIAVFQVFDANQLVFTAALRSAGEGIGVLLGFVCLAWLFFIPVTYYFGIVLNFGVEGLWFGLGLYLACLALVFGTRFHRGHWIGKRV